MNEIKSYDEYKKYKNDKNHFVRGYTRLGCYQGLDFYKKLNGDEKLIEITDVEAFEDYLVFIISHIREIEKQNAELKEENKKLGIQLEDRAYKELKTGYDNLKERINKAIDRLETLIVFWNMYNPIDNTMEVEQFKGVIEILKGDEEND